MGGEIFPSGTSSWQVGRWALAEYKCQARVRVPTLEDLYQEPLGAFKGWAGLKQTGSYIFRLVMSSSAEVVFKILIIQPPLPLFLREMVLPTGRQTTKRREWGLILPHPRSSGRPQGFCQDPAPGLVSSFFRLALGLCLGDGEKSHCWASGSQENGD